MLPFVGRKDGAMERHYSHIVILLVVGFLLTFSASMGDKGISRLGLVLVIASAILLFLELVHPRRGSKR
jgi:amino acid permease